MMVMMMLPTGRLYGTSRKCANPTPTPTPTLTLTLPVPPTLPAPEASPDASSGECNRECTRGEVAAPAAPARMRLPHESGESTCNGMQPYGTVGSVRNREVTVCSSRAVGCMRAMPCHAVLPPCCVTPPPLLCMAARTDGAVWRRGRMAAGEGHGRDAWRDTRL